MEDQEAFMACAQEKASKRHGKGIGSTECCDAGICLQQMVPKIAMSGYDASGSAGNVMMGFDDF